MRDIAEFAGATVAELDAKLKDVRIPRANLGPCPVCGQDIVENRKGFSCWSREDPGCGFVIWKSKAGKTLPVAVARELIATGRTAKAGHRLQGPLGQVVPRPARADAERGRQVARRVRRAVGARGRQAARGRGAGAARRRPRPRPRRRPRRPDVAGAHGARRAEGGRGGAARRALEAAVRGAGVLAPSVCGLARGACAGEAARGAAAARRARSRSSGAQILPMAPR